MCGFLFMETSDLTIEEFKSNLELIEHRGPDDQQHVRDTLGNDFGFCRLSIMDLSDLGRQPFGLNGKRVMCNGEIYNFLSLRKFLEQKVINLLVILTVRFFYHFLKLLESKQW